MTTTFILIILVYIGSMGKYDSNTLTSVPGFRSKVDCEAAGAQTKDFESFVRGAMFICVEQKR